MNTVRRVKRQYNELLDIEGVLLTMYDGRLNLTQQVVEEVKKYFPRKVFKTVIPAQCAFPKPQALASPRCITTAAPGEPRPMGSWRRRSSRTIGKKGGFP